MKTFRKQGLVPKQFRVRVVKNPGAILANASMGQCHKYKG